MENIELSRSVEVTVSPMVKNKSGKTVCYVRFQEGKKTAEGILPEGRLFRNDGFSAQEAEKLELYMRREMNAIAELAKEINPVKAMMKD